MSNFWLVDNEEKVTGSFELSGGIIEPIPSNTNVTAYCEEAKWDNYADEDYISLKWKVLAPNEYKNRIIFQKLKVMNEDQTKAKKAQNMLLAIDHNSKGELAKLKARPENEDLQKALCNKPMILNVQVWEIDDKKGNWISAVKPKNAEDPSIIIKDERANVPEVDDDEIDF